MGRRDAMAAPWIVWCTACVPNATVPAVALSVFAFVFGLVVAFFGYTLFHIAIVFVGFTAGGSLFFFVGCGVTAQLTWAGLCGLIGGFIGAGLLTKIERCGIICCGMGGGLVVALFFNGFILEHLNSLHPLPKSAWVPYGIDLAFALLGGFIAYCLERDIIIVSTALSGSYFLGWGAVRLLSQVMHVDEAGNFDPLVQFNGGGCHTDECYESLVATLLIGFFGAIVQYRRTSKSGTRFSPSGFDGGEGLPVRMVDSHGHKREGYIYLTD